MSNRVEGERVFCYQCENEWDRAHGGLQCPRCESEFVEILAPGSRPAVDDPPLQIPSPRPQPGPVHGPFHNHYPWGAPDPDEDDITTFEFNNRNGGSGTFSFSTRTVTIGGPRHGRAQQDLAAEELSRNFAQMFGSIIGDHNVHRGGTHVMGGTLNFGPRPGGAQPQPFGLPQDFFSVMFEATNPQARTRAGAGTGAAGMPPSPFDFLQALFNPANARSGDMVFSREAFDRVMSQLMEQNNSNGPPPASEDLIKDLPRKKVDKSMLGNEGTAECSICMDGVEVGTEVAVLPCTHWFHFECVESWLKEHDTCPHCRHPITPEQDRNRQASSSRRPRRSSRRSSSVASPLNAMEGIREDPSSGLPDGPSSLRQARERYYGSRRDSDLHRPRTERHGSTRSTGSRDSAGAGVGGWIRNHLPF